MLEYDIEEMNLFFSHEILKNKEKKFNQIFPPNQPNMLESIPKLFKISLKENAALMRKGLIFRMKLQKKKTENSIVQSPLKKNKEVEKKPQTNEATFKKFNNDFFVKRHFSYDKPKQLLYFQSGLLTKEAKVSNSQEKCSKSQLKESDISNLCIKSSRYFTKNFTENKLDKTAKKLDSFIKNNFVNNIKESFIETSRLSEFLPLKYKTKLLIQSKETNEKNKIQKILSSSFLKRNIKIDKNNFFKDNKQY